MKRQWLSCLLAMAVTVPSACGGSGNSPPASSEPHPGDERITGNERLGWTQSAANSTELATYRYAAYVDGGTRSELTNVSCGPSGGGAFSCSSRMPAMSPGSHTIELVSFVSDGSIVAESARSALIRVTVVGATAGNVPVGAAGSSVEAITSDGARLRVDVLTDQLEAPTALAFARDGRVFIAEREGRVRVWSGGRLEPEIALILDDALVIGGTEGGLLGLALDPEFERTHLLYGLYTVSATDGTPRFRLARFREVANRLGERVLLLDDLAASPARPAASIGVGPDAKIYGAFDDAGDPDRARTLASYSGKVLRLNDDGTTPADQPAGSPVYSTDFRSPRGLDWHPVTRALWVVDAVGTVESLRVVGGGGLRSPRTGGSTSIALPSGTGASSLAFYRGDLLPAFRGDLLVAADEGRHLLRVRFDRRDSTRVVFMERLLQDRVADVRVVGVGPDGAVYICTDRALVRIGPG